MHMDALNLGMTPTCAILFIVLLEEKAYRNAVANNCEHPLNNHIILYGKHAEAQAIQYANWLVTTMNQCLPDETWRIPHPHPCTRKVSEITPDQSDDHYQLLTNTVERHTTCSPAIVLKTKTLPTTYMPFWIS